MANYQSVIPTMLGQTAVTTSYTTIYTAPKVVTNSAVGTSNITTSTTRAYLKHMDICNTTAGALTIFVSIVPVGGTASASNAIYFGKSIAANDTLTWGGVQVIMTGATIQVKASGAGLTITASGGEAT